jgi:hypothetical protein
LSVPIQNAHSMTTPKLVLFNPGWNLVFL